MLNAKKIKLYAKLALCLEKLNELEARTPLVPKSFTETKVNKPSKKRPEASPAIKGFALNFSQANAKNPIKIVQIVSAAKIPKIAFEESAVTAKKVNAATFMIESKKRAI